MSLSAALVSINSAITIAKGLRALERSFDQAVLKAQLVDLMEKVTDAKAELIAAQETAAARDAEIARLLQASESRAALLPGPGGYKWRNSGHGIRHGYPICPTCDEKELRQVELKQAGDVHSTVCPRCSATFNPVEFYLEPDSLGQQKTASDIKRANEAAQRAAAERAMRDYGWDR